MRASALPDRPVIVTPEHLRSHAVREAIRQRVARQPGLGFAGLLTYALASSLGAGRAPSMPPPPSSSPPG